MARDHARIQTAIWRDPAFKSLGTDAKLLYIALFSSPKLTWCGAMDYSVKQLADISAEWTTARVRKIVAELVRARFVILDEDTDEIAVRSYIRHDKVMTQPNIAKAMGKALNTIVSPVVRDALVSELSRLYAEDPKANGWRLYAEEFPADFAKIRGNPSPNPSGNPSPDPAPDPSPMPPAYARAFSPSPSPTPTPSIYTSETDEPEPDAPEPAEAASPTARPTKRDDVERICAHLADRIAGNGSKRPNVTAKWRTAARLMLDLDGRTEAQVLAAIDWCQDSEFWRGNVLSMPKLRDQYDQLRLHALRERGPVNGHGPKTSTTDERVRAGLDLARRFAERDGEPAPANLRAIGSAT